MTPPTPTVRPPRPRLRCLPRLLPVLVLCMLLPAGCEESVSPNLGIDRPFTLWGILNPKQDTHAVRLFEIEENIRLVLPDPLDAVVTTTDLQTGRQVVWQDSVIQLLDGDYRHVYWAAFPAEVGHEYDLRVERSDGAASTARTTVPPPVQLSIMQADDAQFNNAVQPVLIEGDPPNLPRIDVIYNTVSFSEGGGASFPKRFTFPYAGTPRRGAEGWVLAIDMRADFREIQRDFFLRDLPFTQIELLDLSADVHVGDDQWASPVGVFDANTLVEPGVFSNVENGFGFFGSGFVETIRWLPPGAMLQRAGFSAGGS